MPKEYIPVNDLSRRETSTSRKQRRKIVQVLKSGKWIHGPEHLEFEKELSEFLDTGFVFGVANGSDALEIALRAVGCEEDSKVITVANAGGYSSIAAKNIGCDLIYCDVDDVYGLIKPSELSRLINSQIDAVIVTHLFGNIAPIFEIKEMCDRLQIKVIEDCAQAIGGRIGRIPVGTIGDISTFSFYPTKNLGAIGDGGAVATNNSNYANLVKELRQYGWKKKYHIETPGGMNSRLDEIQAAILRIELNQLEKQIEVRRNIVKQYALALEKTNIQILTDYRNGSAPHLAVLALPIVAAREEFRAFLLKRGVQTDIHYPVLDCDQPGLFSSERHDNLPVSRMLLDRLVTIPLFPDLRSSEIDRIVKAIVEYSETLPS